MTTTYTIKSGDTLSQIAKAHNTTVENLVKLNKISNPENIKIGQKLRVSNDGSIYIFCK